MHPGNMVQRLESPAVPTLAVAVRTATTNGVGIVVTDFEGQAAFVLMCGAVSGTTPTLDVKIQDSPDGTTWTDVPGAVFAQAVAPVIQKINVDMNAAAARYRAVATIGGTTPSFTFGVQMFGIKKVASA